MFIYDGKTNKTHLFYHYITQIVALTAFINLTIQPGYQVCQEKWLNIAHNLLQM